MPTRDALILVNVAHKPVLKNKGNFHNFNSKNSYIVFTFSYCSGHTIDLCYQEHKYPNFNKNKPFINLDNNDGS